MDFDAFPRLHQAHTASALLENCLPKIESLPKINTKSAPALTRSKVPDTALPAKRHLRSHSRCKPSANENPQIKLRVDSARLFEKLADLIPNDKNERAVEADDELHHANVLDAVASCTTRADAPELAYYNRRAYSSSVKGKDASKRLLIRKPSAPPREEDPGL
jgi:hypothetical protein